MKFRQTKTNPDFCPWCATYINRATHMSDDTNKEPRPGMFMVCIACAGVALYGDQLITEKCTDWSDGPQDFRDRIDLLRGAIMVMNYYSPLSGTTQSTFKGYAA